MNSFKLVLKIFLFSFLFVIFSCKNSIQEKVTISNCIQGKWELIDVQQEESVPIQLASNFVEFEKNTFKGNFCKEISGEYKIVGNSIIISKIKNFGNDNCKPNSTSVYGTNLPNITIAEAIFLNNNFNFEIKEDVLVLKNKVGTLWYKKQNLNR